MKSQEFKAWLENETIFKNSQTMPSPPLPSPPPRKIIGWRQGGWKIHLRTGPDDRIRDRAYQLVLGLVAQNGNKWGHKKLHGGDPDEKDITIYCGSRQEVDLAARSIISNKELRSLLLPGKGDVLLDDMELIPGSRIYGRFDAKNLPTSPYEFTQYGCRGWSMLRDEAKNKLWNKSNYDPCKKSYDVLSKLFGRYFTG